MIRLQKLLCFTATPFCISWQYHNKCKLAQADVCVFFRLKFLLQVADIFIQIFFDWFIYLELEKYKQN